MKKELFVPIMLLILAPVPDFAQNKDLICGSVEKFNQTKRWQDLPGCSTLGWVDSQPTVRLNYIKYHYKEFYDYWDTAIGSQEYFGASKRDYRMERLRPGALFVEDWANERLLIAARPVYEEAYRTIVQRLKWYDIMESDTASINPSIGAINREIRKSTNQDPATLRVAVDHIVPIIDKLKAAGAPDDLIVARAFDKNYTIADIRTLVPSWRGSVAAIAAKEQSDFAAKWQPFLAVLKGDRLELFKKYEVGILQGAGGRTLRTPAEFQRTSFMAKYTNGRSGILNRWNMTIWRFRGDKIIATQTKSGWGDDPPSAAFR